MEALTVQNGGESTEGIDEQVGVASKLRSVRSVKSKLALACSNQQAKKLAREDNNREMTDFLRSLAGRIRRRET